MTDKAKVKIMKRKWNALALRGIYPPKTNEEAKKRLKEAHGS